MISYQEGDKQCYNEVGDRNVTITKNRITLLKCFIEMAERQRKSQINMNVLHEAMKKEEPSITGILLEVRRFATLANINHQNASAERGRVALLYQGLWGLKRSKDRKNVPIVKIIP